MKNRTTISELKQKAKEQLLGNYGIVIGSFVLLFACTYILLSMLTTGISVFAFGKNVTASMDMEQIATLMSSPKTRIMISVLMYILMAVFAPLIALFSTGFTYICFEISHDRRPVLSDMFFCFKNHPDKVIIMALISYVVQLILTLPSEFYLYAAGDEMDETQMLVYTIINLVGMLLNLIFALWISQCYLVYLSDVEKGAVECIKESFTLMRGNVMRYLGLILSFIGYGILIVLSIGIASIWIEPYMSVTFVNFYRDLIKE